MTVLNHAQNDAIVADNLNPNVIATDHVIAAEARSATLKRFMLIAQISKRDLEEITNL
jgi:hypothetical protein